MKGRRLTKKKQKRLENKKKGDGKNMNLEEEGRGSILRGRKKVWKKRKMRRRKKCRRYNGGRK